jgi:hypothetical protein
MACCSTVLRDEAHVGSAHGFADRFGIGHVVLVGLHVWLHELRCHQFYGVPKAFQLPRPVMRAAAGFHADQARLQVGEVFRHLGALQLPAHRHLAALIYAVYLKNIFCQIDANCRNLHFWMPLSMFSGR